MNAIYETIILVHGEGKHVGTGKYHLRAWREMKSTLSFNLLSSRLDLVLQYPMSLNVERHCYLPPNWDHVAYHIQFAS